MARNLTFSTHGVEYTAAPTKVERSKLYGWNETIALDDEGKPCKAVAMDETGTLIIPAGGLGMGILSDDQQWVERASLKTVTLDGQDAPLIKSSFDGPIALEREASAEEFLDHCITAIYQLNDTPPEFVKAVGDKIYTFTYSFRDSYEGSPAFVLASGDALFMLIGYKAAYEMLALAEAGAIEPEDEEAEEESDEIDFSMGL
ncbi:hypothetical protein FACS1894158_00610 [Betaproteobacteria bacterium]|nr:hypothetical protein FACS1894158_00610 [Betaproteobacteria bacterium]